MRLYELSHDYAAILERSENGEDVGEALAAIEGSIVAKGESIVHVMKELDGTAELLAAEIKRLSERKRVAEAGAKRLKAYLRESMQRSGIERIKGPTVSITLSEGPPAVEVVDAALIPPEFIVVERTISKSKIQDHYRTTGEILPGTVIARGTRLTIR